MRISLHFQAPKPIILPIQYNQLIQGLIYNYLSEEKAAFLHETGFPYEKRNFKLFTFSRIFGKLIKNPPRGFLQFEPKIQLQVSSAIDWILQDLADRMMRSGILRLGKTQLRLESIQVHAPHRFSSEIKIKMLAPMTTYSTLVKADGKKLTHYYTPHDAEFSQLISNNLKKKYKIINDSDFQGVLQIKPLFKGNRERIILFKSFVIKAWDGIYQLTGSPELIQVAYDTGLGSKNSQGFGMWELLDADTEIRKE